MPSIYYVRSTGFDDIHIDTTKKSDEHLYSAFGSIKAKGSEAEKLVFKDAKACGDIRVEHVAIDGKVLSDFGSVYAAYSSVGDVSATGTVTLKETTAKRVVSKFNSVTIERQAKTDSKISSIAASGGVKVENIAVKGDVKSDFGGVSAKNSELSDVKASLDVRLTNTTAKNVRSDFGNVTIEQASDTPVAVTSIKGTAVTLKNVSVEKDVDCNGLDAEKSTLQKVKSASHINLIDSSAVDLTSTFGKVSVKQTDGMQRTISHITAQGSVVAQNSIVEDVTLHVDQDEKAVLDLTDSQVGKVVVKVNDATSKPIVAFIGLFGLLGMFFSGCRENSFYANVNGVEFHTREAYDKYLATGKVEKDDAEPKMKHFSLLVKGEELPTNISFEGFEADEISSEKTDEGVLVKGEKKQ